MANQILGLSLLIRSLIGDSCYYLHPIQDNDQIVWSSPVWCEKKFHKRQSERI
jgi:hypothetical protein